MNDNFEFERDASDLVNHLQNEVDDLNRQLVDAKSRIQELSEVRDEAPAPEADHTLRALAATVRQCQRTGHPDLGKHLDSLLAALGV